MIYPIDGVWLLPLFLYAETHYRFPHFFSLLRKNEPEIIADVPHRLEPGRQLPVLIIAKDAHRHPCTLRDMRIEVRQGENVKVFASPLERPVSLDQEMWWQIFSLDCSGLSGPAEVDVTFSIDIGPKTRTYHNDNHRTSSKRPLKTFLARDPLPSFPGLQLGDPHTHSSYTSDQVEFGPPLAASRDLARAMGLSFFAVTDHSYDLDDRMDSYLENDASFPKWIALQQEVDDLNQDSTSFPILRGEEVSCRNGEGRNVHLLLYGQRDFVRGSGDGAEKWLDTRSEHDIPEVLARVSKGAAAYASHPMEPVPFFQRLLLGRGVWSSSDLTHRGLAGLQIINGSLDEGFRRGYREWTSMLLRGLRPCALAGNDAHGNFSRYRQIGIPFLAIREREVQLFGKWRTGVFAPDPPTEEDILVNLVHRRAILTDGPIVRITAKSSNGDSVGIGDALCGDSLELEIEAASSKEFGEIATLRIVVGKIGAVSEQTAYRFEGNHGHTVTKHVVLSRVKLDYVRVEVTTSPGNESDGERHFCFTNPIWITGR